MLKKDKIILTELKRWLDNNKIDYETYSLLSAEYKVEKWDFAIIIRWTLVLGSILLGIGIVSFLMLMLKSLYFLAFVLTIFVFFGFISGILLTDQKSKIFLPKTGNAIILLSCLILFADIFTIAKIVFPYEKHWSILLLVTSVIYFSVAYWKKNIAVLVMGLLFLAGWFGSETGYVSGWGAYYLGLNYPLRFALVSPLVILIGYGHKKLFPNLSINFSKAYYAIGLLYTNISLWFLSILGNKDFIIFGLKSHRMELIFFSLLWLIFDIFIFIIGARFKNKMFTGFSLVFIILNLYTRYFEYFWKELDKWIFFIILGTITIAIGIVLEGKLKKFLNNPKISKV